MSKTVDSIIYKEDNNTHVQVAISGRTPTKPTHIHERGFMEELRHQIDHAHRAHRGIPIEETRRTLEDGQIGLHATLAILRSDPTAVILDDDLLRERRRLHSIGRQVNMLTCPDCESSDCMGKFPLYDCETIAGDNDSWRNYLRNPGGHLRISV